MSGGLGRDNNFHLYKNSRYFTDPLNKNKRQIAAQGTLLPPLW